MDLDSTKVSRTLARKVGSPIKVGMWYTRLRKIKYSFLYSHQAQKLKTGKIVRDYDPVIELMGGVPQQRPQISQWDEPSAIQWIKSNINSPYVVMHFSSLIPVRQLPDELLFPIINFIKKQSLQLILIGVEKDTILEVVDKYSGYPLFNVFNIKELKTIIGHSCFYIGTDSGPLHLAAALNKNGIGFYGPELAKNCGNISDKIITFEKDFSCRPCDQNQPCPYNQRCLKSFDIESITSALDNLQSFAGKLST